MWFVICFSSGHYATNCFIILTVENGCRHQHMFIVARISALKIEKERTKQLCPCSVHRCAGIEKMTKLCVQILICIGHHFAAATENEIHTHTRHSTLIRRILTTATTYFRQFICDCRIVQTRHKDRSLGIRLQSFTEWKNNNNDFFLLCSTCELTLAYIWNKSLQKDIWVCGELVISPRIETKNTKIVSERYKQNNWIQLEVIKLQIIWHYRPQRHSK